MSIFHVPVSSGCACSRTSPMEKLRASQRITNGRSGSTWKSSRSCANLLFSDPKRPDVLRGPFNGFCQSFFPILPTQLQFVGEGARRISVMVHIVAEKVAKSQKTSELSDRFGQLSHLNRQQLAWGGTPRPLPHEKVLLFGTCN